MFKAKNYVKAESLQEAYELNQKKGNVVIGGMHWLKMGSRICMSVIDLSDLGLNRIRENEEEFSVGAMCTLRQLETHKGLNESFHGVFKEAVRHIVGVQFRNGATVGGSVFSRYGFSDVLTCLLALDTYVELYRGGTVSLEEFCRMDRDRDILVRIIIKKDRRKAAYAAMRRSKTDFPVIACAVSKKQDSWYICVGARPKRARLVVETAGGTPESIADQVIGQMDFGSNLRAGEEYRRQLAKIYVRRLIQKIEGEQ